MSATRRIALAQQRVSEDPELSLHRAEDAVRSAAERGAELVCLPELFRTPYFPQSEDTSNFDLAEPIPGPTTEAMQKLAADRRIVVIAPVFERRAAGLYHNTACVIDADGTLCGRYRKMHIPDDPFFYREVLLHAGRYRFRELRHCRRTDRGPDLLGPVVPRGSAPTHARRRGDPDLSERDRVAPKRERGGPRDATRSLAHRAESTRDNERRFRRSREPRRSRQ